MNFFLYTILTNVLGGTVMNETYEWLYDHYALPLMQVRDGADQIKQAILSHSDSGDRVFWGDQLDSLCMLWGTDAFALGLQLGLRLMAGQRTDSPEGP